MYKIQVQELRIGNWFIEAVSGKSQVTAEHLQAWEDIFSAPIPLTSAILEACGFINLTTEPTEVFKSGDLYIEFLPNGINLAIMSIEKEVKDLIPEACITLCELRWLHELQNLFFVLVREELPVNLTTFKKKL